MPCLLSASTTSANPVCAVLQASWLSSLLAGSSTQSQMISLGRSWPKSWQLCYWLVAHWPHLLAATSSLIYNAQIDVQSQKLS